MNRIFTLTATKAVTVSVLAIVYLNLKQPTLKKNSKTNEKETNLEEKNGAYSKEGKKM